MYRTPEGRIATTHTGSLPRSPELAQALVNAETGEGPVPEPDELAEMIRHTVSVTVAKQREVGIDIVSDGEASKIGYSTYVKERLSGYGGPEGTLSLSDIDDHPEFAERALAGLVTRMPSCDGEIAYIGHASLASDLANLRDALGDPVANRAFLPAASPGVISLFLDNHHYPDDESYLQAIAEAMGEEYRAIVSAGFDLQIDCPDLAMGRHVQYADLHQDEFVRRIGMHIEALNAALDGIDPDDVRLHICWGNYEGPHHRDVSLAAILPTIAQANVGALLFENANPRHVHEWRVFEDIRIREDLTLIPGVIDTSTNYIEHPEAVADRITRLAEIVGRDRVMAGTDCGLATFATFIPVLPSIAWEKLRSLSEGAQIASASLF